MCHIYALQATHDCGFHRYPIQYIHTHLALGHLHFPNLWGAPLIPSVLLALEKVAVC